MVCWPCRRPAGHRADPLPKPKQRDRGVCPARYNEDGRREVVSAYGTAPGCVEHLLPPAEEIARVMYRQIPLQAESALMVTATVVEGGENENEGERESDEE